jgi:hypothetical protein
MLPVELPPVEKEADTKKEKNSKVSAQLYLVYKGTVL